MLLWYSTQDQISHFLNPNSRLCRIWLFFKFKMDHFLYFFYMQISILTFKIGPNITFFTFLYSNWDQYRFFTFKFLFWHQYWAKHLFLTFKILFSISKLDRYCLFTFKILFIHSKLYPISNFNIQNSLLIFLLRPNIAFFTIIIMFWHSNLSLL